MTGIQALVRLPLAQTRRDAMNGYHTAGFISGYRGSPVGNYDSFLWQVQGLLKSHNVVFQPGVNEDLAATAIWGTQQVNLSGQGNMMECLHGGMVKARVLTVQAMYSAMLT